MNTADRRKAITEAWEAAWDRGDTALLAELLHDDYRRLGGNPADGHTKDEFLASIGTTREAFPNLVTEVDQVVIEGDLAAIRWHSVGTHEAPMMGIPATHRSVEVSGATFAEFEGDRIVREHVTWDPSALMSALGIIHVGQD